MSGDVSAVAPSGSTRTRSRLVAISMLALVVSLLPAAGGQVEVLAVPVALDDEVVVPLDEGVGAASAAAEARRGAVATPMTFSMVGFELPDGLDEMRVRTSVDGREWTPWVETERIGDEDRPDVGTGEATRDRSHRFAEPIWAEEANHLEVEIPAGTGPVEGELRAQLIDTVGHNDQPVERTVTRSAGPEADAGGRPRIISRAQWGANESWRSGTPSRARNVHMGVVHHTATSNSYSSAAAVMQSMYRYHTQSLGWSDLGYNIVIDRAGNVYEGRAGGLESGVIGAHARGFNTGSFGVSIIGNYEHANPTVASVNALERVIAWQSRVYGVNPNGTTTAMGGGSRPTIVGHRQVGQTACPGRIMNYLPQIRRNAATTAVQFPDVSGVHRSAVLDLADAGVINGCGSNRYCPSQGLTRGQLATLLSRALGLQESSSRQHFSDVPSSHAHRAGIHALAEAGVITGFPDGRFGPSRRVTRAQMATFLTNALSLEQGIYQGQFRDVSSSNVHARAIEAVARERITLGCENGRYCPHDTLRRDQAASLLHRALDH